jgi:integrase/recombinase XerC
MKLLTCNMSARNSLVSDGAASATLVSDGAASARLTLTSQSPTSTDPIEQIVTDFFCSHKDATLRTYRQALNDFRHFLGVDHINQAASVLLSRGSGPANHLVLQYRNDLAERKLSRATINLRLAALRSLTRLGRTVGLITWSLEIRNLRDESYRDCSGPGTDGVRRLLERAGSHRSPVHAARDQAMLRLMFDLALRRASITSLDVEHLNLDEGTIEVKLKGHSARTQRSLPEPTRNALRAWLDHRGNEPGALFTNFDRAGKGQRLTGRSLHRIVQRLGQDLGIVARPHGLRHSAITEALELMGGDVRAVQKFANHADIRVIERYDDNRQDVAGQVARRVAERV